jgi:hypothetical protein
MGKSAAEHAPTYRSAHFAGLFGTPGRRLRITFEGVRNTEGTPHTEIEFGETRVVIL